MKRQLPAVSTTALAITLAAAAQVGSTASAVAEPGSVLKACYNIRALTTNDRLVNGGYELRVHPESAELRQSVTMNGASGPDQYLALTWSRSNPNPPATASDRTYLALHCNGDLALRRASGYMLWHSNTAGRGVVSLTLTSGGNLVLKNSAGGVVWQSGSGRAAMAANSVLAYNSKLTSEGYVSSDKTLQTLSMQTNGNLVYRSGSTLKWQSNTSVAGSYARVTANARLQVVAPSGAVLWTSGPTATSYSVLDIGFASIWQIQPTNKFVWGLR